jgi:hypothetical protein
MKYLAIFAVLAMSLSVIAGVTETRSAVGNIDKITLSWTASGGQTDYVRGDIRRIVMTIGGGSTGTTSSVTLKDENGIDLLQGQGAAVTTNVITSIYPTNTALTAVNDKLTISTTLGGTNTSGSMVIYARP